MSKPNKLEQVTYHLPHERLSLSVVCYWLRNLDVSLLCVKLATRRGSIGIRRHLYFHEIMRGGITRFGSQIAVRIRKDSSRLAVKWHLNVLIYLRRNRAVINRLFYKLLKLWSQPRVIITDKLQSHAADLKKLAAGINHLRQKEA